MALKIHHAVCVDVRGKPHKVVEIVARSTVT